jgi:hypothetical protein
VPGHRVEWTSLPGRRDGTTTFLQIVARLLATVEEFVGNPFHHGKTCRLIASVATIWGDRNHHWLAQNIPGGMSRLTKVPLTDRGDGSGTTRSPLAWRVGTGPFRSGKSKEPPARVAVGALQPLGGAAGGVLKGG